MIITAKAVKFANGLDMYYLHVKDYSWEMSWHISIDIE